jgi:protein-S-isoprenylcysteine O-methyltransferase Ste14
MEDLKQKSGRLVHVLLAHSYFIYLAAIVIGFLLDERVPVRFSSVLLLPVGITFIMLGTILAVWAQFASGKGASSRNGKPDSIVHGHFRVGPYMFTRTPTQYGLALMTIGLAFLYGSFWMAILSIAAFLIGKFFFIKKQEQHLAQKYGAPYLEYKKNVKF